MNSLTEKQLEEKRKKEYYTDRWLAKKIAAGKISAAAEKDKQLRTEFPHIFKAFNRVYRKSSSLAPNPRQETPIDKPPPVSDS